MELSTRTRWVVGGLLALGAVAATAIALKTKAYLESSAPGAGRLRIDATDTARVSRGKLIYGQQCAGCHGTKLEGQPNWRERLASGRMPAPPHDASGHTWHHPDAVLFEITKHGLVPGVTAPQGYESDMPGFGAILSDDDIIAVLAYIKSTWPAKLAAAQRDVTEQSRTGE